MTLTCKRNLTGQKFHRLTVIEFLPDETSYSKWQCICDCGNTKIAWTQALITEGIKSCGCLKTEKSNEPEIHGQSGKNRTKTYNSWAGMMDRGVWGGHSSFLLYGAVGKGVCERWHTFENFFADMGERPPNTSIDRIDNNKGYSPDNCRWATRLEQALNTSRTIKVKINGEIVIVHTLCQQLGLSKKALMSRAFRRGNDYVAALRSIGVDCDYL